MRRGDTCYHVCATWVTQIIVAMPGIQHGESRVTTEGVYSPNVAMSIDLSKAFDTIDRQILLSKLETYAIRANAHSLITSYLFCHEQYVSVLGENSELLDVLYGVPQGSCLGHLLFPIYRGGVYIGGVPESKLWLLFKIQKRRLLSICSIAVCVSYQFLVPILNVRYGRGGGGGGGGRGT